MIGPYYEEFCRVNDRPTSDPSGTLPDESDDVEEPLVAEFGRTVHSLRGDQPGS